MHPPTKDVKIKFMKNKILKILKDFNLEITFIALFVAFITFAVGTNDMECSKAQNICNIYKIRGFKRELQDSFRITDIKSHSIYHFKGTGRGNFWHYELHLEFVDDDILFLPFGTGSEEAAENIYTNIMVQPEYKLKGNVFKTFFDLY